MLIQSDPFFHPSSIPLQKQKNNNKKPRKKRYLHFCSGEQRTPKNLRWHLRAHIIPYWLANFRFYKKFAATASMGLSKKGVNYMYSVILHFFPDWHGKTFRIPELSLCRGFTNPVSKLICIPLPCINLTNSSKCAENCILQEEITQSSLVKVLHCLDPSGYNVRLFFLMPLDIVCVSLPVALVSHFDTIYILAFGFQSRRPCVH